MAARGVAHVMMPDQWLGGMGYTGADQQIYQRNTPGDSSGKEFGMTLFASLICARNMLIFLIRRDLLGAFHYNAERTSGKIIML